MIQGQKDIIRVRIISTAFTTLALAVFKPFGLEVWQWQAYMHLFFLFILGVMVCLLTDFLNSLQGITPEELPLPTFLLE